MKIFSQINKQGNLKLRSIFSAVMLVVFAFSASYAQTVTKHLYLSDPAQALDRIDPVATSDNTTASTVRLQAVADGVVAVATTTGQSNNASSLTFSHTVSTGFNRLLMVGISTGNTNNNGTSASIVSTVTYGGTPMTLVGSVNAGGHVRTFMYALVNPAVGTANIVITTSSSRPITAGATSFTGVNQTTPYGTFYSNSTTSSVSTATVSGISSASNELVYDVVAVDMDGGDPLTLSPGSGQTARWNTPGVKNTRRVHGAGSTKVGSANTTMSWTWSGGQQYAMGAVSLKPAPFTTTATFTQSPALCSPLTVKAGQTISATAYLTILSGSMPANPNITANLKYGATTFATSATPSYNSGTGLLTFSGTLPADVTIPAGQAIVAEIITGQSGVSFQIDYDSQTKPSKISLPVSTFINIDTYAVYDAAYPNGSVITHAAPGATVYLRAVVSDPFGFNDITGLSITRTPPGSNVNATSVATSGCTRTYEYAWNTTGSSVGTYSIPATTKEGYENTVTHVKSLAFNLCTPIGTPVFSLGTTSTRCQGAGSVTYTATSTNSTSMSYSLDATSLAAGNTINNSTGQVTYVSNWSGNSVVTATADGCAGPKSANHTITTNVSVTTPVFSLGESSSRCKGPAVVTYEATANHTTGITYSLDATSLAAGNSINSSTGAVTYTTGWSGTSVITASAAGCGGPLTATHTVFTNSVIAIDDYVTGSQSSAIVINVLANDICDVNPSTLTIINQPQHGTLQLGSGGQVTYLPNTGFTGNDEFVYRVCNTGSPQECDQATVFIVVEEIMDDPCTEATRSKTFYLPFPENNTQFRKALISSASSNILTNNARNIVTIKVPYPGVVITYDHWEDGYETDITRPEQITTLVWGDGDPSNGVAPGYPNDIIPPGGYIILDNNFAYNPRVTSDIVFDGRDKIFSTADVVVAKITGDGGLTGAIPLFNVQNIKTGVVDITRFGTFFIIPFGEDVTLGSTAAFKYTSVFIRASKDGTEVNLDYDGNGVVDVTQMLDEGEVWMYDGTASTPGVAGDVNQANDIKAGATITSNFPVGVDLLFGGIDFYGTRNIPVLPGQFYSNSYYTPIYTTTPTNADPALNVPVYVFFTNSLSSPVTVNWTNKFTSGSVVIPANGFNYYPIPYSATPTGYKFESAGGETFTAVAVIDADASGSAYDWAFNLMPTNRLTSFTSVAWAPGSNDASGNYNPIWVTPTANTTLYIKYDGNLTANSATISPCGLPYDIAVPLGYLETYQVYDDSDNDQSGIAIYTCDGASIAAVWGQDSYAKGSVTPTSSPAQDVGYYLEPRCLQQLVFANDDYVVTEPEKPIIIGVSSNDFGFLTTVNNLSVNTIGVLQPTNGSIVVNPNGTITYTPNTGFEGIDTFEYTICSADYPNLCDLALVTVRVTDCATTASENLITGVVFIEQLPDDGIYNGENLAAGVQVDLYADLNCNGVIDAGENIISSTVSDFSGNYSISVRNGFGAKDKFGAIAFNGNDGGINWSSNWVEQGDDGNINTGYVRIMADAVADGESNAIRLSGNVSGTRGISRSLVFDNANSAALRFRYRRQGLNNQGEALEVLMNGSQILSFDDGDNVGTDVNYHHVVYPLGSYNANGTNTVLFRVNNLVNTDDFYWVDDVELVYFKGQSCYIVKVDPSNTNGAYSASSLNEQVAQFNGVGVCERLNNLGVLANLIVSDDQVNAATDIPLVIDVLENDVIGKPDPATVSTIGVSNQPANGVVTVNPDGTITYTPNPGFIGTDDFEYSVCSLEDPQICDVGLVTVTVSCISISSENTITGLVFSDLNVDGIYDAGETGFANVAVYLYRDLNDNGIIDTGESVVDIQTTSVNGTYQFTINPGTTTLTYLDQFNANTTPNQSHGTAAWTSSWTKIGDSGTFGQNDIQITSANGLRIQTVANTVKGAYRTANLGSAIYATLSFKYTESGMDLDINDYVDVEIATSASPSEWTLIKRITGANGNQSETLSFDISDFISSTTTVRFVTNASPNMVSGDIVYFDDVQISFDNAVAESYIVQLGQPIPVGYALIAPTPSPVGIHAIAFTGAGAGSCQNNFALSGYPIAKNDVNTTFINTAVSGNVLTNDRDPKPGSLSVTVQTNTTTANGGTVTVNADGTYTYTPDTGFTGKDSFAYEVCDAFGLCANALVVVDVVAVPSPSGGLNDPPIAVNDAYQGLVNTTVTGNVISNDFDADGDLNMSSVVLTSALPNPLTQGVLSLNANGTFTFVPISGFTGQVIFTYQICDTGTPQYCDAATVTIDILPNIVGSVTTFATDDAFIGPEDSQISGNVLSNDYDPYGRTQTVNTTPVVAPQHGNLVLNPNGTFTYTPDDNFYGQDKFVYEVCNNGTPQSCNKATVYLNVFRYYRSCIISNRMTTIRLQN